MAYRPPYHQQQQQQVMSNEMALAKIKKVLEKSLPDYEYSFEGEKKNKSLIVKKNNMMAVRIKYDKGQLGMENLIPSKNLNRIKYAIFILFRKRIIKFQEQVVETLKRDLK